MTGTEIFWSIVGVLFGLYLFSLLFLEPVINFFKGITELKKKEGINEEIIKQKDLEIRALNSEINKQAQDLALVQLEQWKQNEFILYKKKIEESAYAESKVMLQRWLIENEERIRKDAANRSVRNVMGKVTEQLLPFSEAMSLFNPKDARFLGSPIDLIIFDGSEELKEKINIVFIEVKTGTAALSKRQRLIKEAIEDKRVYWKRVNMKDFGEEVNDALNSEE